MNKNIRLTIIMVSKYSLQCFLLLSITLSSVLAESTVGQVTSVKEQSIRIRSTEMNVESLFKFIEEETEYRFVYHNEALDIDQIVSLVSGKQTVADVLVRIAQQSKVNFKQINELINVKKVDSNTDSQPVEIYLEDEQQFSVSGRVTDDDGEGLPGTTIAEKGTANGTVTDVNGDYSLTVSNPDATLVFSFVGFVTQEIPLANRTRIDVTLDPDIAALQEIVVVGYGTQEKSDLTGSVISADLESFSNAPNTNILQALSGSVAGINIDQVSAAGAEPDIQVRGQTTINGNQSPLVVLDGAIYRGRLSDLNPGDIESIDILKDASSQAIYGAQAANGVILVTTKKGRTSDKPTISYSTFYSTQSPSNELTPLGRDGYIRAARDVAFDPSRLDDPEYVNPFIGDDFTQENPDWTIPVNSELNDPMIQGFENGTDFNWYDDITDPGFIVDHQLSISGGTDKSSYYISGGYTRQEGWMLNDEYERKTVRINYDTDITDWLTIGANTFGSFSDFSGETPTLNQVASMSPLAPPRDEDGELIINPLDDLLLNPYLASQSVDEELRNNFSGIFFLNIDVPQIEGLSYRLNFSNNYNTYFRGNANEFDAGQTGEIFKVNQSEYDVLVDNIINYKTSFGNGDHGIDFTFVAGMNRIQFEGTRALGQNIDNISAGFNSLEQATVQFIDSEAWEESFLYQTGRISYDYQSKYFVTATLRRDGFSGFAEGNKFGLFPSAGIGWTISEESFLAGSNAVSNLKLRASYGTNGNLTNRYSSQARVASGDLNRYVFGDGGSTVNGQTTASIANNDLTWEKTAGLNVGIDFGFVNNRISGSLDLYQSTTTDLLWDLVIPQVTGFGVITSNIGEVENRGIELVLNATPVQKSDFRWDITLNMASNQNEIVELLGVDADGDGREDDLIGNGLFIGESIGTVFGYRTDGLWQLGDEDIPDGFFPGTQKIIDTDGEEGITPDDRVILGREEPALTLGLLNSISYKNFTLTFFIKSIQGGSDGFLGVNNPWANNLAGSPGNAQNVNWLSEIDYWSTTNTDAEFRRPGFRPAIDAERYFARDFIRLQDISLAYNLPSSLLDKIGFQRAKVFVSGKNLLTITDWDGWDPETGQGLISNALPIMKGFSVGLDVSF